MFLLPWLIPFLIITGLIAFVSGLKAFFMRFLAKTFLTPLRTKGEVLKGATITIHEVVKVDAPKDELLIRPADLSDEQWEATLAEEEGYRDVRTPRDWYRLDVTIIPPFATGPLTLWEPAELVFVPAYTLPGSIPFQKLDDEEPDEIGFVRSLDIWQEDGTWKLEEDSEDGKYDGPQRLRLLIGVDEGTSSVRFRYYFEIFGLVELTTLI